ncbi:neoverrucotoxin subunit beta-like [Acipenser ruthenus]|uniref:neoverrucotoxin subunit beta-like n=1 Tax=Acipenser ruthenus TaxID=7906 RepID=UPI00274155F9|nr:neoverrucotoxin subunit beta-like [Acipenser ruthenus]
MTTEERITIELATLGRPFQLGMLYDCRNDSLIPGMTLWDMDTLKKDVDLRSQHNTEFQIIASDSIEDKSSALNIEASLKASFLGGLVEVKRSAKYLKDTKSSKHLSSSWVPRGPFILPVLSELSESKSASSKD